METLTMTRPRIKKTAGEKSLAHKGNPFPLGATVTKDGVNFSVFSKNATGIDLLFFKNKNDVVPNRVVSLDPVRDRMANYWFTFLPDVKAGQIYAYRVTGPNLPEQGLRFDPEKVLLDPYGLNIVVPDKYSRQRAMENGDNVATAMKSVVIDSNAYDWENDAPLNLPSSQTIIYEMHVRGFTNHPNSGVSKEKRGTYAGLIEKIPYLKDLGITAVELLPVFQFDFQDCPDGKVNYWGYSPVSFFSPHQAYSSRKDPIGAVIEFRDMVKALHRAGIEVILDVVYNHTAEGGRGGPTICYRGFENEAYYTLGKDKSEYSNYTGCGNTLNANQPACRRMILDSLRYWVQEMHVDGFRFDLTSILSRDSSGHPMANPPLLWDIDSDPVLAGTKLIAEAWDAAGLYQVGSFIGDKWKEWNGRFRDDVRSFLRGDQRAVAALADRLLGSPAIYAHKGREAEQSVNFVTCHDGFTLYDLVSYNQKHNLANGEANRDGNDNNISWNCGEEGATDKKEIKELRLRQIKNFHTINLLSLGIPMILMGDEVGHSQLGNNNAYCQDNELSWFNWAKVEENSEIHRFVKMLASRRTEREVRAELKRLNLVQLIEHARIEWHGVNLNQPDWGDKSHSIAISVRNLNEGLAVYWIINGYWEPLTFELPVLESDWKRWIDTSMETPHDIVDWRKAVPLKAFTYTAEPRSTVVLVADSTI